MELRWKKHILSNDIKFLLGSVTLSLCEEQGATKLLDFAVSALEESQQEIGDLRKENARPASEWQGALARFEKCANLQEDIEKDLFGKLWLLNEKKAKIRCLMEQFTSVSEQLQQSNKTTVGPPASEETKEDPSSQSDNETDDDIVHSPSPIATEWCPCASPTSPS